MAFEATTQVHASCGVIKFCTRQRPPGANGPPFRALVLAGQAGLMHKFLSGDVDTLCLQGLANAIGEVVM
jgi:hypothetical protein